MLKKLKLLLSVLSLPLLLSGCLGDDAIKDVPACEDLQQWLHKDPVTKHLLLEPSPKCMSEIGEPECGHCVWIVSRKEKFVGEKEKNWLNKKPWSQLKAESVYLPAEESYGPLLTGAINACKKMNCNDQVTRLRVKLNVLNLLEK